MSTGQGAVELVCSWEGITPAMCHTLYGIVYLWAEWSKEGRQSPHQQSSRECWRGLLPLTEKDVTRHHEQPHRDTPMCRQIDNRWL